jgi:3-deoxy-D-manno-octulosonic acid kinase
MSVFQTHLGFRFGSIEGLGARQLDFLILRFREASHAPEGVLSGRVGNQAVEMPGFGRVVIKQFFRGGVLRHVNRRTFLGPGRTRPQKEFERLMDARRIGVNAPEPVAFAVKGRLFYHGWLITRELPNVKPLSMLSLSSPGRAEALLPAVIEQVLRLIEHRIFHVDLHPGNVLVREEPGQTEVYLIDFDKAVTTVSRPEALAGRYCRRWHRAVVKYGLPTAVSERFQEGIKRSGKQGTGSGG